MTETANVVRVQSSEQVTAPGQRGKVLVAAVGYVFARDLSVGPHLVTVLKDLDWSPMIEVDDWSFGPIDVVHRLHDRPGYYGRIVFVSSVERGRTPGGVYTSRWAGELPDPAEVQARVGEAGAGVISLDNLLIVAEQFKALPSEVFVVEVEPLDTGWGDGFSPVVEAALPEVIAAVRRLALDG